MPPVPSVVWYKPSVEAASLTSDMPIEIQVNTLAPQVLRTVEKSSPSAGKFNLQDHLLGGVSSFSFPIGSSPGTLLANGAGRCRPLSMRTAIHSQPKPSRPRSRRTLSSLARLEGRNGAPRHPYDRSRASSSCAKSSAPTATCVPAASLPSP